MDLSEIKTDFSWKDIELLIKIKNSSKKENLTISNLCKYVGIKITNPRFYQILSYLMDNEYVVVKKVVGNSKFLSINYKKIKNLIDEQENINFLVDDYIKKDHNFIW